MAEAKDLKSFQCGFEPRLPYQPLAPEHLQHRAGGNAPATLSWHIRPTWPVPGSGGNVQMDPRHILHEKGKETGPRNGSGALAGVVNILQICVTAPG